MEEIGWLSIVSIILASIGALLGIINTSYLLFKDKVRLELRIRSALFSRGPYISDDFVYCLEVINMGFIPVTVSEVGFLLPGGDGNRIPFLLQQLPGAKLPYRLEPRTSVTVYATEQETEGIRSNNCKKAFVDTDCRKRVVTKIK